MKTCLNYRQTLWLDVYGELDPGKRPAWERHLDTCEDCRKEREKLIRVIETAKIAGTTPKLAPKQANAMVRSVTHKLQEEKDFWNLRNWLPEKHVRLIPVVAAASILLVAVGWFNLPGLDIFSPVQKAVTLTPEERRLVNDLELIENLDLLKEMEALQKLVQMIDQPKQAPPGYGKHSTPLKKDRRRIRTHAQYYV